MATLPPALVTILASDLEVGRSCRTLPELVTPDPRTAEYGAAPTEAINDASQRLTFLGRAWRKGRLTGERHNAACLETLQQLEASAGGVRVIACGLLSEDAKVSRVAVDAQLRFEWAANHAATIAAAARVSDREAEALGKSTSSRKAIEMSRRAALQSIAALLQRVATGPA